MTQRLSKVSLGRTMATKALVDALAGAHKDENVPKILAPYFTRHSQGDWGDMRPGDCQANETALEHQDRVMSAYRTEMGVNFWIITDPGWATTTALLPEDY